MSKGLTGGCLCGKIRYALSADVEPVYSVICHCINCKKATGTHMANTSLIPKDVSRPSFWNVKSTACIVRSSLLSDRLHVIACVGP